MSFFFISRQRYEDDLQAARDGVWREILDRARQRTEDAIARDAEHWRAAAVEAQRALVELQRRYAPPEPVPEGEIAQPPSVDAADRLMVRARQTADGTLPLVRDPRDGDRHAMARGEVEG